MYEGLYDTRKGLSPKDAKDIGEMTALLMLPWAHWVHRRVDRVTFSDEDALCRDVSIDFTLPHWFHNVRKTPKKGAKRQLVPLGFFRKEALLNFSLRDEAYASLPLLTAEQTMQVSDAVLMALASSALEAPVPKGIEHDLYDLVRQSPEGAADAYHRLFNEPDGISSLRERLGRQPVFVSNAALFQDGFLALFVIDIGHHQRRVVHFSFEEQLSDTSDRFIRMIQQAIGQPRQIAVAVSAPSSAASYHVEVEAPEGLMITDCAGYEVAKGVVKAAPSASTLRRAHSHFKNAPARSRAGVEILLHPRRSSIIRPATLTAMLTLIATAAIAGRFPRIEQGDNAAAAALLLAVTGIVGLIVARSGEGEMATSLLLPLRVLAVLPAVLGVFATIVVVTAPTEWLGYVALGVVWLCMVIATGLLLWNWHKVNAALAEKDRSP